MAEPEKPQGWRKHRVVVAILLAGTLLRLGLDNVPPEQFSRADETYYLLQARRLSPDFLGEFPALARDYLADQGNWGFATPVRWAYFLAATVACGSKNCTHHSLTWLSTISGILALLFSLLVARELMPEAAALAGVALVAVSPLQLAMGRRALSDQPICAAALATLWVFLRLLRSDPGSEAARFWNAAAVLLATLSLALKESFVWYVPAFFGLWLWSHPRRGWQKRDLLLLLPPVLLYLSYSLITQSFTEIFTMARIAVSVWDAEFPRQYSSGPGYRYLIDLLAISPAALLLAVAACGLLIIESGEEWRGVKQLAVFIALSILAFGTTVKNARYIIAVDALVCLLAGWFLFRLASKWKHAGRWLALGTALIAIGHLAIFNQVFLEQKVYDPTTDALLRALEMVRH